MKKAVAFILSIIIFSCRCVFNAAASAMTCMQRYLAGMTYPVKS